MPAFRSVQQGNHCAREEFLYELKAGPAGGLRPPSGPAATRRSPGYRPHPPPRWYEPTPDQPHDLRSWGETEDLRSSPPWPTQCLAASDTGWPRAGHGTRASLSDDHAAKAAPTSP
jgi:hypothetical protein